MYQPLSSVCGGKQINFKISGYDVLYLFRNLSIKFHIRSSRLYLSHKQGYARYMPDDATHNRLSESHIAWHIGCHLANWTSRSRAMQHGAHVKPSWLQSAKLYLGLDRPGVGPATYMHQRNPPFHWSGSRVSRFHSHFQREVASWLDYPMRESDWWASLTLSLPKSYQVFF